MSTIQVGGLKKGLHHRVCSGQSEEICRRGKSFANIYFFISKILLIDQKNAEFKKHEKLLKRAF